MDELEKKEEKNKRIAWMTSVGVQLVLLLLFYFIIAWKAPFPPIPDYGIELGFESAAGAEPSSTPQPSTPPAEEKLEETEATSQPEETSSNETEVITPIETVEESETEVETTEPEPTEESSATETQEESVPVQTDEPATEEDLTDDPEEVTEETEEDLKPVLDERGIMTGNEGNDSGTSEGASLNLAGWVWDFKPKPDDQSTEVGKIVYKIVVDQDGYLIGIETETSTVSPSVERKYREAVQKLTFTKISDGSPALRSEGTVTFIIKTK